MCHVSGSRPQNTQNIQNAQKAFQPQDLANKPAQQQAQGACGPKGIDQLFNQDRLEKAGAANKAAATSPEKQVQQAQQAQDTQKAEAAGDPKEMMKNVLGALGDILKKVIDGITGGSGLGDMFKNLLSGIAGGAQQQPQLPPAK